MIRATRVQNIFVNTMEERGGPDQWLGSLGFDRGRHANAGEQIVSARTIS